MRVLRVHAPGADPRLAASIEEAVREFNGGLDIRLRFLSIGIEETVVAPADAASAAEQVEALLGAAEGRPATDAVLLLGGGEAAIAAAAAAARARVVALRVGAGDRSGRGADAARAADRLCGILLAYDEPAAAVLRDEGPAAEIEVVGLPGDPAAGRKVVRALSRARRRRPC